jgi:molybdopterin-guanine dinucleotide biosynthesis protein A
VEVNNPFAPPNFVVPSETFTETDSAAQEHEGEFLDVLASFWNDNSNQLASGNEKEETERFDESFSQASCQFYAIEEASVGSMEDSDSKGAINDATAVNEQVVANLWHKNIL